jgi:hypothetical protein
MEKHTDEIIIFSNMVPASFIELKPTSVETGKHGFLALFYFYTLHQSN